MDNTKCFAYRFNPRGWSCSALNVTKCEYPNCRTFKTKKQVVEQKKACLARIRSYNTAYQEYLELKYGKYVIEDWDIDDEP